MITLPKIWIVVDTNTAAERKYSYVGKHPTPWGGRDFENFHGGENFLEKVLEGDRFFDLKGGDILYNSAPKFQNFPENF